MFGQCVASAILFGASGIVPRQAVEKRGLAKHDVRGLAGRCWRKAAETMCLCSLGGRYTRRSTEARAPSRETAATWLNSGCNRVSPSL